MTSHPIIDFIEARTEEDRALAQAAINDPYGPDDCWFDTSNEHIGDHYRRHEPKRVLRDVEAKEVILAQHAPKTTTWMNEPDTLSCGRCGKWDEYPAEFPCWTLQSLAAVWRDHPDYQKDWDA